MFATSVVLGYHGCDKEVGERILRGDDHVGVSSNRYDWLGAGAYFCGALRSPAGTRVRADAAIGQPYRDAEADAYWQQDGNCAESQ